MLFKYLVFLLPLFVYAQDGNDRRPAEVDQASSRSLEVGDSRRPSGEKEEEEDPGVFTRIKRRIFDDDDDEEQDEGAKGQDVQGEEEEGDGEKPKRSRRRRRPRKSETEQDDESEKPRRRARRRPRKSEAEQEDVENTKARRSVRSLKDIAGTALFVEWAFALENYRDLCKAKVDLRKDDVLKQAATAFAIPIQSYRDAQASGDVAQMRSAYLGLIRLVMRTRPTQQRVKESVWTRSKINENIFRRADLDDAFDARSRLYSLLADDEDSRSTRAQVKKFRKRESKRLREIRKQAQDLPDDAWTKLIHPEVDLNRFVKRYILLVRRAVCISSTTVKPVRRYLAKMLRENFDSPSMVRELRKRARSRGSSFVRDSMSGFTDFWTKRGDASQLAGITIFGGLAISITLFAFL